MTASTALEAKAYSKKPGERVPNNACEGTWEISARGKT